jgi:hypothetical protein
MYSNTRSPRIADANPIETLVDVKISKSAHVLIWASRLRAIQAESGLEVLLTE